MKKVKELKSRIAVVLMITLLSANMSPAALGAVFKKSMKSETAAQIVIKDGEDATNEAVKMRLGSTKTLSLGVVAPATPASPVRVATGGPEQPASASDIKWSIATKTDAEPIVEIVGSDSGENCVVKAVGMGPATINVEATVGGVKRTDTRQIYVQKEALNARLSPSKIDYSGSTKVTADVKVVTKADVDTDVKITIDYDTTVLSCEEFDTQDGTDAEWNLEPINGQSGTHEIKITATINGEDLGVEKVLSLTVNPPKLALQVADDKKVLDVKGGQQVEISVDKDKSEFLEYGNYKWSVESLDPETEKVLSLIDEEPYEDSVTVEAKAAGQAVVKLIATTSDDDSPGTAKAQETEVTAQVTITVNDTRKFDTETEFIVLDINPDPEKEIRTAEFEIINDFDDEVKIEVIDETETVTAEFKEGAENIVVVSTDAEEIGSAKILVKRLANEDTPEEDIEVPVIILTSAEPPTVENDLQVGIGNAFTKEPTVDKGGITLSPAQELEVGAEVSKQKQDIVDKITEALTGASKEVLKLLATKVSVSSDIAKEFGSAKDGEIVTVYPKQQLNDVQMKSIVTVNEDGKPIVTTIITKMVFNIELFMDRMDAQGNVYGASTDLGKKMSESNNKKPVSFPVPLPQKGIKESARYAKVTHKGDVSYYPIEEEGGSKFVVISTTNFSSFEFEFVDSKPSTGSSSRGGGRSSAASTGKWSQDTLGWRYRGSNGTYATNEWKTLLWNGTMQWYRFSPEGYMVAGWFTDVDANKYFLHNISDGSQGKMYTGWNMIEGKWYYFKEYTGGPYGSLLVNGVTPDGYAVGADGVCLTFPGIVR